ncbi:MAG: flagellar basal body P-ring protein FlgI [Planctomycetales bacterium]
MPSKPFPRRFPRVMLLSALCTCLSLLSVVPVEARVRLENLCVIQGQKEHKLVGLGLVVGLAGTGDGAGFVPTIRALGAALKLLNNPVDNAVMLKDSKNVALVTIEASIPAMGIRKGQKIDCTVHSIGGAKSLRGGRLMASPLQSSYLLNEDALGLAGGSIIIEDPTTPTSGKITNGVIIEENFEDFAALMIENCGFNLLLDKDHASFHTASEIAAAINRDLQKDLGSDNRTDSIARAVSPGAIRVEIPKQYLDDPVTFIALVLDVGVDNPHTEARVVTNSKTGTIVVTGEVQISPIVISHKNLSVTVGDDGAAPAGGDDDNGKRFVPLIEGTRELSGNLKELETALNQLQVPKSDIIDIIREMKNSGKLHAVLITE